MKLKQSQTSALPVITKIMFLEFGKNEKVHHSRSWFI